MFLDVWGILLILLGIATVGMLLLVVITASEDLDQNRNDYPE